MYLPLGSERIQTLNYQESEQAYDFDSDFIESLKLTPNRWVATTDKNGRFVVVRYLNPKRLTTQQKNQYEERKNCGWFSV